MLFYVHLHSSLVKTSPKNVKLLFKSCSAKMAWQFLESFPWRSWKIDTQICSSKWTDFFEHPFKKIIDSCKRDLGFRVRMGCSCCWWGKRMSVEPGSSMVSKNRSKRAIPPRSIAAADDKISCFCPLKYMHSIMGLFRYALYSTLQRGREDASKPMFLLRIRPLRRKFSRFYYCIIKI